MMESSIGLRRVGDEVVIRVAGRATAVFGADLREALLAAQTQGVRRIVFDLGQCAYMDSTFIGVLAMAAAESRRTATEVQVANAGPTPRALLAGLGVDGLFTYVDRTPPAGPWEPLVKRPATTAAGQLQAMGRTALAAHEALGAANPQNVPRFKDVIESLRRETQARQP